MKQIVISHGFGASPVAMYTVNNQGKLSESNRSVWRVLGSGSLARFGSGFLPFGALTLDAWTQRFGL